MNKITRIASLQKLVEFYGGTINIISRPSQIGFFKLKVTVPNEADSFAEEAYQKLGFFYEGGDEPDTYERNESEFVFAI